MDLTSDQEALRQRALRLAETELAPHAAKWDRTAQFPERSLGLFKEQGFLGMCVPKEYGGQGFGILEACLVLEGVAHGCMASAMALQANLNGPARVIAEIGSEAQKKVYLPDVASGSRMFAIAMTEPQAGSDGLALETTLTPHAEGYRLSGTKCHITGGDRADTVMVFCRAPGTVGPNGIGVVVVERGAPGFSVLDVEEKMGGRGVNEAILRFQDVEVKREQVILQPDPTSAAGAKFLLVQFNPERCGNAAMALGVAQSAFDYSLKYSKQRNQFGRPIAEFQGVQWKFADMAVALDASRLLLWRAARSDIGGFPAMRETAMAKLHCNETAIRVCNEAIGLLGHKGYLVAHPLERNFRDVRGMAIAGGTVEVLRNIIGGEVTGLKIGQRRMA